jgi:hypothetical protein
MEELEISGRNFMAKKAEGSGKLGADGDKHTHTTRVRER